MSVKKKEQGRKRTKEGQETEEYVRPDRGVNDTVSFWVCIIDVSKERFSPHANNK